MNVLSSASKRVFGDDTAPARTFIGRFDRRGGGAVVDNDDKGAVVMTLYETDLAEWAFQNAELLRSGRISEADLANIAEEIEDLGRSLSHELKSRLMQILEHLLKLRLAPPDVAERNRRGWMASVERQRVEIQQLLKDSPSLTRLLTEEVIADCYAGAAKVFEAGFGIDVPADCPFSQEDILCNESHG
jgi:hypothetical protein